ncbi:EF-hand domain-containing protein [Luteolibacter flavescens]|uniref:EF-hand domain-containing protein n=1 Tax=Luteolibacter flavescens TaxID=1859460 RepID=A0ABT3FNM6_9BACT|nr:EF-hand domain-containing protein [Luteolibacter flavescens]MCW1884939.1 EF-hand domain-containing protein [Luteolibacter flavescens]
MKSITAIIALSLAILAPAVTAAPETGAAKKKPNPQKVFKKKDGDKDGHLTKEEFLRGAKDATKREKLFKRKDKDKDGKLTLEEFKAQPKAKAKGKGKAEGKTSK